MKIPSRRYSGGVTLIEVMIVLALVAILASMAAPSFTDTIRNNRTVGVLNDFIAALNVARSEAIKRGAFVTVCISANGATCKAGGTWEEGWLVFVDGNNDGVVDAGEELLLVHDRLALNTTLRAVVPTNFVMFNSRGFLTVAASNTFKYCDERGIVFARGIILLPAGRPNRAMDTNNDGIENMHTGANITCP